MTTGILVSIAAIFAFVVLLFPLIIWLNKRNNAKYDQLWPALTAIVGGTSQKNTMTGSYNGMAVQSRIRSVSDSDNSTEYYYELVMTPGAQGSDWALSYGGDKMLGLGKKVWQIKTKNDQLKARLAGTGVLEVIEQWPGNSEISYKAKSGTLKYDVKVKDMFALPTPEEFRAQLDLLSRFAQINGQVNA